MAIAVVLDPRNKLKIVEWAFTSIYDDRARGGELDRIRYLIHDLLDEYKKSHTSTDISSSSVNPLEGGSTFLNGFDSFVVDNTMSNQNGREVSETYLKEPLLPRTQIKFDILGWWKNQEVLYPTLRLIAKDILTIPVSTVVFEYALITSGRLLRADHSTLDPNTVESLMYTQNWLRNQINGQNILS